MSLIILPCFDIYFIDVTP